MPSIQIEIRGQSFGAELPNAPVQIGTTEGADLRIEGAGIAAVHCVLEPLHGGLHKLRDAKSGRPTTVNGIAVRQVSLRDGDVIEVGEARIVYNAGAFAPPAAQAPAPAAPARAPAPEREAGNGNGNGGAVRPAPASTATSSAPAPVRTHSTNGGEPASDRAHRGRQKSVFGALVGLLAGAAALVVIVLAVGGTGGNGDEAAARRRYDEGQRLYEARDYAGARSIWTKLAAAGTAGFARRDAEIGLRLLGDVEREMERKLDVLWTERLDLTTEALASVRATFVKSYGELQAPRFDDVRGRVLGAQARWKKDHLEEAQSEVAKSVGANDFVRARETWRRLGRSTPAAVDVGAEVDAGLAAVETSADEAATKLLAQSQAWIDEQQAWRSASLLEEILSRFVGTQAHARVAAGLAAAREAASRETGPTPGEPGPGPAPGAAPTPATPSERAAHEARAREALAKAQEQIEARRYGDAALFLKEALEALPAGDLRADLAGREEDLRLAEKGLEHLITDINAHTGRYRGVQLNDRLKVSLAEADRDTLSAVVTGGRSKYRWERVAQVAFPRLADRMRPGKDSALPVAALLRAVGCTDPAERALYQAGEKGVATERLFAVLARWRSETVPEGGYVVHEGRYERPERREFLIREARIEEALARVGHREAPERAAAYATLHEIGEPARERFESALTRQRRYLVDRLVASRSFTGNKYKAKLLKLLAERRRHALVLIYDARAYPYPNPNKKNQKEVEERVDQVREIWERPFDLVAQWDKKLGEHLTGIVEVDEQLSQVAPGYQPDLDGIKDRINKAIDMPAAADQSLREYSLKVLGYNETLTTTATNQEKDNTRVVNAYRMMMGLAAVKIEERLLRAARGHSRHMQQNNYFAHQVPAPYATPENRSPGARAKRQGFGGGVGENIARGPGTGRGAFNAWFGSSGHHRNMLGRGWLQMGCGRAGGTWWTQLFASGSKSLKPPDALPDPEPAFAPDPEDVPGQRVPRGPVEVPDEVPPGEPVPPEFPPDDGGPPPGDGDEPK